MVEVRQSNPKAFEELNLKLMALQGTETRVGWGENQNYKDGTPVAYVATIQEFGHGPIPPRPFMRPAVIKNQSKWQETAGIAAARVIDGKMTGHDAMDLIGLQAADDVRQEIENVKSPPLSLVTLWARWYKRRKGKKITGSFIGQLFQRARPGGDLDYKPDVNDDPLKDTGYMIATLKHETTSAP